MTTALLALAWLLAILVAARSFHRLPAIDPMKIDLLDRKLNSLEAAVHDGSITPETRAQQVAMLIRRIDEVTDMQALVDVMQPDLVHARLISTSDAPELEVHMMPGTLFAWRDILVQREFRELGIGDHGYEYRGPYTVRLVYPLTPCAAHHLVAEAA